MPVFAFRGTQKRGTLSGFPMGLVSFLNILSIFIRYFTYIIKLSLTIVIGPEIITGINRKDTDAFTSAYLSLRPAMLYYAQRLFRGVEVDGEDIVQDIFISIWEKHGATFTGVADLKAYMYAAIRNRLKNSIRHAEHTSRYRRVRLAEQTAVCDMAQTELLSLISHGLGLLPVECARVMRMHLEGWDIGEIAEKLGKSTSTVYHQRAEALRILREKIPPEEFGMLALLFLFPNIS